MRREPLLHKVPALLIAGLLLALSACAEVATLPVDAGMGPHPTLPQPNHTFIPTVNIAHAVGWPLGRKPTPAAGLAVTAYASGLAHPRYGQHVDARVKPARPDLVARALAPDYALGLHTASLGLAFNDKTLLPSRYAGGAFVGQHGSWNRTPQSGYKLIFIPFLNGQPVGQPQDVLHGFLSEEGEAYGRPVGVALDHAGALLVADDVGNVIWRVTPAVSR